MHGGIKAAEKSAHPIGWKGEHVKHQMKKAAEKPEDNIRQHFLRVHPL